MGDVMRHCRVEMVLFDLDGTLIDSFSLVFKGYKKAIYHFSKVYMTDKQVINLLVKLKSKLFTNFLGKKMEINVLDYTTVTTRNITIALSAYSMVYIKFL